MGRHFEGTDFLKHNVIVVEFQWEEKRLHGDLSYSERWLSARRGGGLIFRI